MRVFFLFCAIQTFFFFSERYPFFFFFSLAAGRSGAERRPKAVVERSGALPPTKKKKEKGYRSEKKRKSLWSRKTKKELSKWSRAVFWIAALLKKNKVTVKYMIRHFLRFSSFFPMPRWMKKRKKAKSRKRFWAFENAKLNVLKLGK